MATNTNIEGRNSIDVFSQRQIIKFMYLEGLPAAEAHRRLVKVMTSNALSQTTVKEWYRRFKLGNFDVEEHRGGDHKTGPETDKRVKMIQDAFNQSRSWSITSLSAHTGIPRTTCFEIITKKLNMSKLNAKWIPHELTPDQKNVRVDYARVNLRAYNQQPSRLKHTVTIDETWINLHRSPEKDQAKQWLAPGEKRPSVAQEGRFGPKLMLVLAMDYDGICYYELLNSRETMDHRRYIQFLDHLMDQWGKNHKHLIWLLDDNAKPHRHSSVEDWMGQHKVERWIQPPYSPDLSPCDFGCFHQLKRNIGGVAYRDADALREALDKEVMDGNKHERYQSVQKLPERWQAVIKAQGDYL